MVGASTFFSLLAVASIASAGVPNAPWKGEVKKVKNGTYQCKCYSDNSCWPKARDWKQFNASVDGTLQVALPPGAPCYNNVGELSTYDAQKCSEITTRWGDEQYITDHPVGNLWPFYTNNTCLPTTDPKATCTRGFYPEYVILATKKEHIQAGVNFAREHNLRLLIRNTGHDFLGRSAGWGTLAINTHSFKSMDFQKKYNGPGGYKGSYAKVGAGVQGREMYRKAFAQDPKVVVVGGECPTVGFAGGYLQGGGHGPLAGIYGMGADQVLEWEVITADGEYRVANAEKNADLYWALKGGGPSTFAVVLSVTVKTHPEIPVAGTILNINTTHTDHATIMKAFRKLHSLSNTISSNGMFGYFELGVGRLHVQPIMGPRMNAEKVKSITKPLFDYLEAEKIPHDTMTKEFPTFFEFYMDIFEDEASGPNSVVGGRLFTQRDIAEHNDAIVDSYQIAIKPTPEVDGFSIGHIVNPGYGNPDADNAIAAFWRNASCFTVNNVNMVGNESWELKQQRADLLTWTTDEAMRKAAPYSGVYVNEGNLQEPNWQTAYWGDKYPRLLQIKKKWDPSNLFYAQTTPGTEGWEVIDYGTKLCKKVEKK